MNKENEEGKDADAVPSGVQGICPSGWHLPSKAEWKILENFVAEQLPLLKEMYGKMILETNTLIQIARMFGQH